MINVSILSIIMELSGDNEEFFQYKRNPAVSPPSTTYSLPLQNPERGLARKQINSAVSATSPSLPNGTGLANCLYTSSTVWPSRRLRLAKYSCMGVMIDPGETTLIITPPPRLTMLGIARWQFKYMDLRLTAMVRSHIATSVSVTSPIGWIAAELTKMSIPPYSEITFAMVLRINASSEASP